MTSCKGSSGRLGRSEVKMAKGTNLISPEDQERVRIFLKGCGPYQADLWSNSYYSEIVDFLNEREKGKWPSTSKLPNFPPQKEKG
jgi:hypothetical protein